MRNTEQKHRVEWADMTKTTTPRPPNNIEPGRVAVNDSMRGEHMLRYYKWLRGGGSEDGGFEYIQQGHLIGLNIGPAYWPCQTSR